MKTFLELGKALWDVKQGAIESIKGHMTSKGVTELHLATDSNGLNPGDDGYDMDSVWEDLVWTECYGMCTGEDGWVSTLTMTDGSLEYTALGRESFGEYGFGRVSDEASVWVSILGRVESMLGERKE